MEERVGYIMKSMLSKMVKKVHRDDRGLSLVEALSLSVRVHTEGGFRRRISSRRRSLRRIISEIS